MEGSWGVLEGVQGVTLPRCCWGSWGQRSAIYLGNKRGLGRVGAGLDPEEAPEASHLLGVGQQLLALVVWWLE